MLQLQDASGWSKASAAQLARIMAEGKTKRRLRAHERQRIHAQRRAKILRSFAMAAERTHIRQIRKLMRELGLDRDTSWGRTFRIRSIKRPPKKKVRHQDRRQAAVSLRSLGRYRSPLKDSRGRVAVFFRARYLGLKSKGYRAGLAADHIRYILREDALDNALDAPLSNIGDSAHECAEFFNALEVVESGYRANAIVQNRIIVNLPHQLNCEQRTQLVSEFCRVAFARYHLPYVAAVHRPDKQGDHRNYHAHIAFSSRPAARAGEQDWIISEEKLHAFSDKEGLMRMRALFAAVMNRSCRDAGLPLQFTHQSYYDRGIKAERTIHLGPARSAAFRTGAKVAAADANSRLIQENEAEADSVLCEGLLVELKAKRNALAHLDKRGLMKTEAAVAPSLSSQTEYIVQAAKRSLNDAVKASTASARMPIPLRIGANADIQAGILVCKKRLATAREEVRLRDTQFSASSFVPADHHEQLKTARAVLTKARQILESGPTSNAISGLELRQRRTEPQRSNTEEIDKRLADWLLAEKANRDESARLAFILFQDRSARAIAQAKLKEEEFEKLRNSAAIYKRHHKQDEREQTPCN